MIKKILLITTSAFIISACSNEKPCTSYDDVYGIHFGCDLSYTKSIPNIKNVSASKELGSSTHEIEPFHADPFDFGSEAMIKLYDNKISIVFLAKRYRGDRAKVGLAKDIERLLNDFEEKWGEIRGKDSILDASRRDLSKETYMSYDSTSAEIIPLSTNFLDKIHLEFGIDQNNNPVFSASFIGK